MKNIFTSNKKVFAIIAILLVLGGLAYFYKGFFVAATVNGKPISRFTIVQKLEAASGKQTLDSLITEILIKGELDKNSVSVDDAEIDARIKQIEDGIVAQGGTLEEALTAEKLTLEQLRDQISIQSRIEKFLSEKTQVSDEDINKYIVDNKIEMPKGEESAYREQIKNDLKSQKFNQVAGEWVASLQSAAAINYYKYNE